MLVADELPHSVQFNQRFLRINVSRRADPAKPTELLEMPAPELPQDFQK